MELSLSSLEIEMRNEQCSNDHDLDIDPFEVFSCGFVSIVQAKKFAETREGNKRLTGLGLVLG